MPGRLTTAFLVLGFVLGSFAYRELDFRLILDEVREGRAGAGLLIHEGQLTYAQAGLVKALDLGEWWQSETGLPLPLGVNAIRRDVSRADELSAVLGESIEAALGHREEALRYALRFARDLDEKTADEFVSLYVNDLTRNVGEVGQRAIDELLRRAEVAR